MKKRIFKRGLSAVLAIVMCLSTFLGIGTTTAFAADVTDDVVMFSFPREGDSNFGADWGHGELKFMNGWFNGSTKKITVYRTDGSTVLQRRSPFIPSVLGTAMLVIASNPELLLQSAM